WGRRLSRMHIYKGRETKASFAGNENTVQLPARCSGRWSSFRDQPGQQQRPETVVSVLDLPALGHDGVACAEFVGSGGCGCEREGKQQREEDALHIHEDSPLRVCP